MEKYRLVYFNMRGRAEPIRWMFSIAKQSYKDERFEKTSWPTKKKELIYEKIPVLYVDGKPLSQSVNICRYLGKVFNLHAEDPWDAACCDEVADAVHDLMPPAAKILYAKQAGNIEEMNKHLEDFLNVVLPPFLAAVEDRLTGREWFGGSKMTWADVYAACYLGQMLEMWPNVLDKAPKLRTLVQKVLKNPEIATWIQNRPKTDL